MADISQGQNSLYPQPAELSYALETEGGEQSSTSFSLWKAWVVLFIAILLEVGGTTAMKLSDGLTRIVPTISIYVLYGACFALLPLALKSIELSTAYAVWSGLGTVLTALIGFVFFKDTVNWIKVVSLIFIMAGCVAIKYSDGI